MNKRIFIVIGIILAIAAYLRFYQIEGFMTFLGDQGRDAIVVKRIVTFEHFPAIGAPSSVGQIYLGPFYYYLISPFLLIFNFNPAGLGIGVAILSILALIYIAYEMYQEYGGLITAVFVSLMTFSFSLIELSRFSWNPNLLPYFSFIALYFFYKWIIGKSWLHAVLFGSFLAFAFQLHYLTLLIFLPIGGYYIYTFIKLKDKFSFLKQTVLAVGAFIFFSVPLILFDLRHNFLNSKNFLALFTENKIASDSPYFSRFQDTVVGFIHHALQIETTFLPAFLLLLAFVVGSFFIAKKQKNQFINVNIIIVIAYLVSFALLESPRHIHYFGPAYLSFYFVLSFFVLLIPKRKMQFMAASVLVLVFLWSQTPHYYFFTQKPNNQIQHAKTVAESFDGFITKQPIQVVALPFTETDGHYRYFLELKGYEILPLESPDQAEELYVMCFDSNNCQPLDDPHWQIAAFYNKGLAESWDSEEVTIYKVIHKTND